MSAAPIGVFDSGVGGLSVLRHIRERLPGEALLYVADSAHVPYGDKTTGQIRRRVFAIAEALLAHRAKALVVACNTATAAAIHELRAAHPQLPIIGMEPGLKPAVSSSRSRKVGILATAGTLRSGKFSHLLERYGAGAEVVLQACPGLVEQIEAGRLEDTATAALLQGYLTPLLERGVDALVLGCTHYPFLLPLIQRLVGPQIAVIDTGAAVARQLERQLHLHGLAAPGPAPGPIRFFTSGDPAQQQPLFARLWGAPVEVEPLAPQDEPIPRPLW
jgi:glutamate racemase